MEQTVQSTKSISKEVDPLSIQEMSPNNNLGDLIDLNKDSNKLAIVDEHTKVTYGQLHNMSNYAATILQKEKNINPGDRVGLKGVNTIGFVAAYLGILKMGAVAVLINPQLPQSQVEAISKNDDLKFVWIDPSLPKDKVLDFEPHPVKNTDPAVILYTSGSSSNYKGVIRPHQHKIHLKYKFNTTINDRSKLLIAQPLTWASGIHQLEIALVKHATIVFLEKFDSEKFLKKISLHKITRVHVTPSMLIMMLKEKELISKLDLSSLRNISTSSAPISKSLWYEMKEKFPKVHLKNIYGTTENGPAIFGFHPTLPTPDLSVGYPVPGIDYKIVNGVLQIRTSSNLIGYTNTDNNSLTDDGYFITNDLFSIDENGFYFFLGRADDMFTCGGNNIYPKQIENILIEHPSVKDAAVIGIEDEVKGHKPYAFVISDTTEDVLKEHVLKFFPPSHCPRNIWNVEEMPLNRNLKVDKKMLIQRAKNLINNRL